MLFPTFKKKIGLKKLGTNFRGGGGGGYIYIKIVVLASEPVGGRSRATELPCFILMYIRLYTCQAASASNCFKYSILF